VEVYLKYVSFFRVSILGYVVKPHEGHGFDIHKGRDITSRQMMHFNQISLETYDDG
jgi:hypothetical protein